MKIKGKKIVAAAVLAALAVLWPVQAAKAQSIEDALEADSKAVEAQEPGEGEKQEEIPDGGTETPEEPAQDQEGGAAQTGGAGTNTAEAGPLTTMGNSNTVSEGVYIGSVDVSGKTAEEAKQAVEAYVEELKGLTVVFHIMDGNQIEVSVGDMGLRWTNPDAVQDAVALGKKGNIVQRYKALQDLRHKNKVFDLAYDFDKESIRQILSEQCGEYNTEARDATLTRVNGVFSVTPGESGRVVDEEASLNQIYDYMMNEWDFGDASVDMVVKVQEPRGSEEELAQVKDVLGTFTTSYSTSGSSRSANVSNGCDLIAGTTLYPGDEFSTYEMVSPFSAALRGVPGIFPKKRGGIFCELLRLLPAGGLHPPHGHVHRKGLLRQRGDRPPAAVRHRLSAGAPGRDRRRLRVLHLRPGRAGGFCENDGGPPGGGGDGA